MLAINRERDVWALLAAVPDPEIPIVSVTDLGMIRNVRVEDDSVEVAVAPTYSGCPATEVIEDSIAAKLRDEGFANVTVRRVLSPPWTTDWISPEGRDKLRRFGIAPPLQGSGKRSLLGKRSICCPRCGSEQTTLVSEFGSTACKASCKCDACLEPFEYFKCI